MKDEILSYREMCNKLHINTIQRGMNFRIKKNVSVILMSVRKGAPYHDEIDTQRNVLIYEGHDVAKSPQHLEPKKFDQPTRTHSGTLTQNGKFVKSCEEFKKGLQPAEKILVFEKLDSGVWSEKGAFLLADYFIQDSNGRKVFKFILQPIEEHINISQSADEEKHDRIIPTAVKVAVWKRDRGKCAICQSTKNLHYDHDLPFSRGGSSITEKNVRILCAKCNLKKSDKIE